MVSNTFAMIGVREIGRKSEAIDVGGWALSKILADFHISCKTPFLGELLKIVANGLLNILAKSLKIHAGISSGPVAC